MHHTKAKLLKSKSSNTCLKTSPCVLKKRGVYVEKNPTKTSVRSKSPPTPKPDKSSFLNNILSILSKSTTGTQCPDSHTDESTEKVIKRQKYRSKYINGNRDRSRIVILQSTKEIIRTPSLYSSKSNEVITPTNEHMKLIEPKIKLTITASPNAGLEKPIEKKVSIAEDSKNESTTIIADLTKKDDKAMYNFFVDLLETTINDVKGDVLEETSPFASKNLLEIDEAVVKKLNINKPIEALVTLETKTSVHRKQPNIDNLILDESYLKLCNFHQQNASSPTNKLDTSKQMNKRKKVPVFTRPRPIKPPPLTIVHEKKPKKTKEDSRSNRRSNITKKQFLNSLKKELLVDNNDYEDSQFSQNSFFQALKNMARNKRINHHKVYFDESKKENSEIYTPVYKQRNNLLSRSAKSYLNKKKNSNSITANKFLYKNEEFNVSPKISKPQVFDYESASDHSIEVHEENHFGRKPSLRDLKPTISVYSYHSPSPDSVKRFSGYVINEIE